MEDETFELKGKYAISGFILTVIPLSVFIFLIIVLVKVICLSLGNFKKRKEQFGQFHDDLSDSNADGAKDSVSNFTETENVVGIYFNYME